MSILGYILLFYIGFYYYRLAENHNKNKWLYVILGVILYFIGLIGYTFFVKFLTNKKYDELDIVMVSIKAVFTGVLVVFIVFQILDTVWERKRKS